MLPAPQPGRAPRTPRVQRGQGRAATRGPGRWDRGSEVPEHRLQEDVLDRDQIFTYINPGTGTAYDSGGDSPEVPGAPEIKQGERGSCEVWFL